MPIAADTWGNNSDEQRGKFQIVFGHNLRNLRCCAEHAIVMPSAVSRNGVGDMLTTMYLIVPLMLLLGLGALLLIR